MTGDQPPSAREAYWAVADAADGQIRDYRRAATPLARGGQGEVVRAVHKATGVEVAFKASNSKFPNALARMRREIEIGRSLRDHPNVMPVLDASPDHEWFVMPLADATLEDCRTDMDDDHGQLRACIDSIAAALRAAHDRQQTHRDIKPANVLRLDGRWRLADWGLVRNPVGETTNSRRTGSSLGTAGFAAPELSTGAGAHAATPASDIYSLGQLIGWILTGNWPAANTPLLPTDPSWRHVVAECTRRDPARRPQDIDALMHLIDRELEDNTELAVERAERLKAAANEDDAASLTALLALAASQPDDGELYIKVLSALNADAVHAMVVGDSERTTELVEAMAEHRYQDPWPTWADGSRVEFWLLRVCKAAAREEEWALLDVAATSFFQWVESIDQWDSQNAMKDWLRRVTGNTAVRLAAVLRRFPGAAGHYEELIDEVRVSREIRVVLKGHKERGWVLPPASP